MTRWQRSTVFLRLLNPKPDKTRTQHLFSGADSCILRMALHFSLMPHAFLSATLPEFALWQTAPTKGQSMGDFPCPLFRSWTSCTSPLMMAGCSLATPLADVSTNVANSVTLSNGKLTSASDNRCMLMKLSLILPSMPSPSEPPRDKTWHLALGFGVKWWLRSPSNTPSEY